MPAMACNACISYVSAQQMFCAVFAVLAKPPLCGIPPDVWCLQEVASHVGPADCPCQHGTLAAPSAAETVVQLPQTKASSRKGSSSVSTSSLAAMFDSLPPVTDLSFGHGF